MPNPKPFRILVPKIETVRLSNGKKAIIKTPGKHKPPKQDVLERLRILAYIKELDTKCK